MSMMPQSPAQDPPSSPPPSTRARLSQEWQHFATMPLERLFLLALPSLVLLWIDPLLPIAAYTLQIWAGSAWAWRDRWTSIRMWAKQATWWSVLLLLCATLNSAQVWFFPSLIHIVQTFWHTHLSGDLSLSPFDGHDLLIRSLLLLPLAPVLTLFYERIDPRTQVQRPRVLIQSDRDALKKEKEKEKMASSSVPPTTDEASAPPTTQEPPAKKKRTARTKQQSAPPLPAEQMTIESFLTPNQVLDSTPAHPAQTTVPHEEAPKAQKPKKKKHVTPPSPVATPPPDEEDDDIDWSNVAE